jgi:hypothetical protein
MPHYTLGIDPGQSADPTALALLEQDQVDQPIYRLRALHRFPIGTPYTELPRALWSRLTTDPLDGHVKLAIDATGVGAPVVDYFRDHLPEITIYAITITAGTNTTGTHRDPHVPKRDLISTASVILEQRRLHIAANMRDTPTLSDELLAYRRTLNECGYYTYQAASGSHDDLVLALSLALWTAEHKRIPSPVSYKSSYEQLRKHRIPSTPNHRRPTTPALELRPEFLSQRSSKTVPKVSATLDLHDLLRSSSCLELRWLRRQRSGVVCPFVLRS